MKGIKCLQLLNKLPKLDLILKNRLKQGIAFAGPRLNHAFQIGYWTTHLRSLTKLFTRNLFFPLRNLNLYLNPKL